MALRVSPPLTLAGGSVKPNLMRNGQTAHFGGWDSERGAYYGTERGAKITLTNLAPGGFYPDIAVLGGGRTFAVWEQRSPENAYSVWGALVVSGTKQPSYEISGSVRYAEMPQLAYDVKGVLHLVFQSKEPAGIWYQASFDNGLTWRIPVKLGVGYYPKLAVDEFAQVHVVWNGEPPAYGIRYRLIRENGDWDVERTLGDGKKDQVPDIAIASKRIAIVWGDYVAFQARMVVVARDNWNPVAYAPFDLAESLWARVTAVGNDFYVVAQGRTSVSSSWDIFLHGLKGKKWLRPQTLAKSMAAEQTPDVAATRMPNGETRVSVVYTDGADLKYVYGLELAPPPSTMTPARAKAKMVKVRSTRKAS